MWWSPSVRGILTTVSEIIVDVSQPPFCLIRHPQQHRAEDFEALFERLKDIVADGSRWAVLVDLRKTAPIGGSERAFASAEILKNLDFIEKLTVCEARVTSGPLMRGVLTVLDWVTPRSWPIKNFGSGVVAEDWLRGRLVAEGIPVPDERVWVETPTASS